MTEIINLNKRRKATLRENKEALAVENRRKYGRTKQEKSADKLKAEKLEHHIRSHKRETPKD